MSLKPPGDSEELTAASPPGSGPASASRSISGTSLAHFEVLELLGRGGFGEVYRARDVQLGRTVALKILPEGFAGDAERRERFRREAIAASALNHPNICTVYELLETADRHGLVMEMVEGTTLRAALADGPLPAAETLGIAIQVADALAEAHRAGILHRDIKSGNIMLTPRGQVKVLDFGLAKLLGRSEAAGSSTLDRLTAEGAALGTLGYMAPEQLLARPIDQRSDLFSFGVVLYEMVTGRLPFEGSTPIAVSDAILHASPRDFGRAPVPEKLQELIKRLLEKDPARRPASAEELREELLALKDATAPARPPVLPRSFRIALVAAAVVAVALGAWAWRRSSRARWAREAAAPEIARLVAAEDFPKAAALAHEARAVLPNDPTLKSLWSQATTEVSVESTPPGADVSVRPYRGDPNRWESLGQTPLQRSRVPKNFYVWRISKPGFAPAWRIAPMWGIPPTLNLGFRLDPEGSVPWGMVGVPGGTADVEIPGLEQLPEVPLDDYLIDQCEVTNEEFKKFVDAGGYEKREFWKQPFVRERRTLPWEEAMALFRDGTGRAGPATWELGSCPQGLEKHPVGGVSWWEAAAYAEFAGKSLPTIYHWSRAAQKPASHLIAPGSHFQGAGTVPVRGERALSGFGTYDMAGNVKEWCWNESSGGKRFILGGGFGEPTYMFVDQDAQSPWHRRPNYGFRCVKLPAPPPEAAARRIDVTFRDLSKEKPVSDEVFRAFKRLYAYDRGGLSARVEETETTPEWTREKVSIAAAYGGERVLAYLYLPKNAAPPFQTVVFFPGSDAIQLDRFVLSPYADFVSRSGRALMAPIYKGTFERRDDLKSDYPEPTAFWRDHMIAWSKDLGRSVDYLETRKDIDPGKLAYLGLSWGSAAAPVLLAVESRFRTAILAWGGLELQQALPEVDVINFVTRVKVPVLMLNGRYDHFFPVETSQLPLYRLLGTPEKDKRHVIYETGHAPPRNESIRESLDWLDRYLGPVKR